MSTLQLPARAGDGHSTTATGPRLLGDVWAALSRWFKRNPAQPAPRQRTAAEEAREVRDLAVELQRTDPRFAAELFAAADRHERLYG